MTSVFGLLLDNMYKPIVTGNNIIMKKISYLNCIAVSANPRKNFEKLISIRLVKIDSPKNTSINAVKIMAIYEANIRYFFFVSISLRYVEYRVIRKNGAT
tara:strand:+ start:1308 stop:1607 length:300 start_codon:yes stop_codon:yes gene_type:complete